MSPSKGAVLYGAGWTPAGDRQDDLVDHRTGISAAYLELYHLRPAARRGTRAGCRQREPGALRRLADAPRPDGIGGPRLRGVVAAARSAAGLSLFVPVLAPRYFAWSAAPFFILAGAALGRLSRVFAAATAGLGIACLVNLIPYYGYETKPRWDLLAAQLAAAAQPGDVVLLDSYYSYSVLSVFAARTGLPTSAVNSDVGACPTQPGSHRATICGRCTDAPVRRPKRQSPEEFAQPARRPGGPGNRRKFGRALHRLVAVTPSKWPPETPSAPTRPTPGRGQLALNFAVSEGSRAARDSAGAQCDHRIAESRQGLTSTRGNWRDHPLGMQRRADGAGKPGAGIVAGGQARHQQLVRHPEQLFGRGHGPSRLGFAGRRHAARHDRLPDDGDDAAGHLDHRDGAVGARSVERPGVHPERRSTPAPTASSAR